MENNWPIVIAVFFVGISAIAYLFMMIQISEAKEQAREDLQKHQEWLFNQLYSLAPGKVVKPEDLAPEEESRPAEVYNPNKDPMREFKGKMNDFGW